LEIRAIFNRVPKKPESNENTLAGEKGTDNPVNKSNIKLQQNT